ncbi:MAG: Gp138 family membrane-puncturing spike protein [Acutalibacteraceae bacterium]|nr:Gp138 family membrane-puncturing spike protein [Acutalibacteraceae bacterium]
MSDMSHAEREALKQEIFASLHVALPGNIVSFDEDTQTAEIQPAIRAGSMPYPVLSDVPVFMPVSFDISPGDPCLVIFADINIDAWLLSGEASVPLSARRHSLSDGFAFVGFRRGGALSADSST